MSWGKRIILIVLVILLAGVVFLRNSGQSQTPSVSEATPSPEALVEEHPESISAVMSASELKALDTDGLKTLDLSGSTCYDAILEFIAAHPKIHVTYTVALNGNGGELTVTGADTSLSLPDGSYIESLASQAAYLPALRDFTLPNDTASAEQLDALRAAFPDATIHYLVSLLGKTYPYDVEAIDLSALTPEQLDSAILGVQQLPYLAQVELMNENGESALSISDAAKLAEACPGVNFNYYFELFGKQLSTADETLEFENEKIGNEGVAQIREVLPFMTNLTYLKLDSCGVDNEVMAELRDDYPDIKVVWRVFFGEYNCLTDTEWIWATGSVTDGISGPLKYCTDVKYIDMGHNCITNIDFVNYMPKLEVAVFAITWVTSVEPLANCPDLEYLEIFSSRVSDLSPLANCTHLKHLNISHLTDRNDATLSVTDISSLYDLPEIERFYCTMSHVPQEQQDEMIARHPDCEFEFGWVDPAEGAWRFDENGERNERYALLCEQFGYDTFQQSGKIWSNG